MEREPAPEDEQPLAVRAHDVSHHLAPDPVAMQPDAPVERETQSLTTACKLPDVGVYWQAIRPSMVAAPIGGPRPVYR